MTQLIDRYENDPGPLVEKLQRNLAKCRQYNAVVRILQATVDTLRATPPEGASRELKKRLQGISQEEGGPRR